MAQKVAGSNPVTHPIVDKRALWPIGRRAFCMWELDFHQLRCSSKAGIVAILRVLREIDVSISCRPCYKVREYGGHKEDNCCPRSHAWR